MFELSRIGSEAKQESNGWKILLGVMTLAASIMQTACDDKSFSEPSSNCQAISAIELMSSLSHYANSDLCVDAVIRYIHGEPYIATRDQTQDHAFEFAIPIDPGSDIARFSDLRSGDHVTIAGHFFVSNECLQRLEGSEDIIWQLCGDPAHNRFEPSSISVNSRNVSTYPCLEVPIAELYASPLEFNETVVCTTGYVMAEETELIAFTMSLVPDGFDIANLNVMSMEILNTNRHQYPTVVEPGDHVRARGRFGLSEECYRQYQGEDMGDKEWFCFPVQASLWLMNADYESID